MDFQKPYFKNLIELIIMRNKSQRKKNSGKVYSTLKKNNGRGISSNNASGEGKATIVKDR